jgi:hypothetical protein
MSEPTTDTEIAIELKDILTMRELIELCATRGLLHPKSFVTLGTLWSKLDSIVAKFTPPAK